jgi:phosphatidylserine/phosphatidylglycerophosphate/cardiolipin synthase-like enzyme
MAEQTDRKEAASFEDVLVGALRYKYVLLLLFLAFLSPGGVQAKDLILKKASVQVYFSPKGGCTEAIVEALDHAKSEVLVQAYSFTSAPIAKALADAYKRGVHVEMVLDKSNRSKSGRYSAADFTAHAGIPTYIDAAHAIAHNKVMVIDKETVITGSFNFTKAAENNNAENLLIILSKQVAGEYIANWEAHRKHSEVYGGK